MKFNRIENTKINSDHLWVLNKLKVAGYRSAIVAGGAVRDTYFKKQINDIDIFYWHSNYSAEFFCEGSNFTNLDQKLDNAKWLFRLDDHEDDGIMFEDTIETVFDLNGGLHYGSRFIVSITEMTKNEQDYQLIGLSCSPEIFIKNHQYADLSRCWCDGTKLRYTGSFLKDARNQTITLAGDVHESEYDYSVENHLPKLQYKFPSFTVVDLLKDTYNS